MAAESSSLGSAPHSYMVDLPRTLLPGFAYAHWLSERLEARRQARMEMKLINIRRHDRAYRIVAGTSMEDVGHGPFRPDNIWEGVDFLCVHPYTI